MKNIIYIVSLSFALFLSGCGGQAGKGQSSTSTGQSSTVSSKPTDAQLNDLKLKILDKGEIVFGVKADAPPFGIQDEKGDFVGFDIDIAKAIAKYLAVEAKFVPVTSKERIPFIKEGKVDAVIASMTITRGREAGVDFSYRYFEDGQGLLCQKGTSIKGYSDLKGKVVAAVAGSTSSRNMRKVQPKCRVKEFNNYDEALASLTSGEVDALTSDYMILMGLKNKEGMSDKVELVGGRFTVEPYGIALPENQSDLRDEINRAILYLWDEAQWHDIYNTWFGEGSKYEIEIENNFRLPVVP